MSMIQLLHFRADPRRGSLQDPRLLLALPRTPRANLHRDAKTDLFRSGVPRFRPAPRRGRSKTAASPCSSPKTPSPSVIPAIHGTDPRRTFPASRRAPREVRVCRHFPFGPANRALDPTIAVARGTFGPLALALAGQRRYVSWAIRTECSVTATLGGDADRRQLNLPVSDN